MTLDSGLRRNDVLGIMLCPDIFEPRPFETLWTLADRQSGSAVQGLAGAFAMER